MMRKRMIFLIKWISAKFLQKEDSGKLKKILLKKIKSKKKKLISKIK